jgi:hypothetical protein
MFFSMSILGQRIPLISPARNGGKEDAQFQGRRPKWLASASEVKYPRNEKAATETNGDGFVGFW